MDLKSIRKFLGLTQKEFAEKMKLSQSQVSAIEQGQRKINERLIMQIALVFDLNDDWVRSGKGDPYTEVHLKDSFLNELVQAYSAMSKDEQEAFKSFLKQFGIIKSQQIEEKI